MIFEFYSLGCNSGAICGSSHLGIFSWCDSALNPQKFPNLILPSPLMLQTQVTRTRPLGTLIHQIQEAARPVVGTQPVEIQE
jgi:hypothetical protein